VVSTVAAGAHGGDQLASRHQFGFLQPPRVDVHQRDGGVRSAGISAAQSPTMFFMKIVDPAPMKAILVT
jgi:hypothetical protein